MQRYAARLRFRCRGLEFRAGLYTKLLREAALVGGEPEVGGEQRDLAVADHLTRSSLASASGSVSGLQLRVEFDRDGVEVARIDRRAHGVHARLRHMRGAEQGVAYAVARSTWCGWPARMESMVISGIVVESSRAMAVLVRGAQQPELMLESMRIASTARAGNAERSRCATIPQSR